MRNLALHLICDPRLPDRFWAKVRPDFATGCWIWQGQHDGSGYAGFHVRGRYKKGHRVAYAALVGPIPPGLDCDHLCRVRDCVNPLHIEPVTRRENVLRGKGLAAQQVRRTQCPKGHPYDLLNTYYKPDGGRECRECQRAWGRIWAREHRVSRAAVPPRRLQPDVVRAIFASNEATTVLARKYGISRNQVWRIKTGKSWPNLTQLEPS